LRDDVRGPDALDLVEVDSDLNAVLCPDGTLALLDALRDDPAG
jgi:hypothetical protein